MGADLDGSVAGIGNFQLDFAAAFVGDHVRIREDILSGNHETIIPFATVPVSQATSCGF
jgi:hypothetical protein